MKYLGLGLILATTAHPAGAREPDMCGALRDFVESVRPDETREFRFRTSWGENFRDNPEPAFAAKRCDFDGYDPAKKVCDHLMQHGATEFSGNNVKAAIMCLSKKTLFAPRFELNKGAFRFAYGSEDRGALIEITFEEDNQLGGMLFKLQVDGY